MSQQNQPNTQAATSVKAYMDTPSYRQANAALQAEINRDVINIDRSCFKKTPQEKAALANAKKAYKNMVNYRLAS